jgi:hypothetical protein
MPEMITILARRLRGIGPHLRDAGFQQGERSDEARLKQIAPDRWRRHRIAVRVGLGRHEHETVKNNLLSLYPVS